MAAKRYNLNIPEFDGIVDAFISTLGDKYTHTKDEQKGQIIYRIKETGQKKDKSVLTCYISLGQTSFSVGGTSPDIAQKCSYELINSTQIKIAETKTFTIKPATDDEIEAILEFLGTDCGCVVEEMPISSKLIKRTFRISGLYKDVLTLTHYNTGTLLAQGRPTMIFFSFIDISTELFTPSEIKREHLKIFDIADGSNILDANLSSYLPNAYSKIGIKMDAIMAPSLILLNSPKDLTDFSTYAYPVLRGAEGVLKKVFNDNGISITDGFGNFFTINHNHTKAEWVKDCSILFPNELLRKSLLDLYFFYYSQRHSLFHMDATIETSRTLNYNEALEIVTKGLSMIDEVFKHVN